MEVCTGTQVRESGFLEASGNLTLEVISELEIQIQKAGRDSGIAGFLQGLQRF